MYLLTDVLRSRGRTTPSPINGMHRQRLKTVLSSKCPNDPLKAPDDRRLYVGRDWPV